MVLIPNDIGIRMRLQNEAQLLQPVAPVAEIATDISPLRTGQFFTAHIQEALPQGTYKALVAGRELTLALPENAKSGDTLELIVVDRSAKVIVAQLATTATGSETAQPYPFTKLSHAAQLIGALLPPEGESAKPVLLNAGQPLLSAPPTSGPPLAAALQQAIKFSGLFYEAHQAQWVSGRYPLVQLLDEPQAQHSDFSRLVGHLLQEGGNSAAVTGALVEPTAAEPATFRSTAANSAPSELNLSPSGRQQPGDAVFSAQERSNRASESPTNPSNRVMAEVPASSSAPVHAIPDDVRSIVQQQLDALAMERMAWHGEAWPQQHMEWEIERDAHNISPDDQSPQWNTTLALRTPNLGEVCARLQLTQTGVRIVINADSTAIAESLRTAAPLLQSALAAAGVPLLSFFARDLSNVMSPAEPPEEER